MQNESIYKSFVPLSRVVNNAAIDMYASAGDVTELYSHWIVRKYRELNRTTFKKGVRYAVLTVNRNTSTATLPADVGSESDILFIGVLNDIGERVPLDKNGEIVLHDRYIEEMSGVDKCDKCNQPKKICEDLQVSEEEKTIVIDGVPYTETIVKKMYPNGDYYLERNTPAKDLGTGTISYYKDKRFITGFDIKECGCFEESDINICKLRDNCPDLYCRHFAPVAKCNPMERYGSYKVFEEHGVIQLDRGYEYSAVYIEYLGFLPKRNGTYYIPEVAVEPLVEWAKFKSVDGKTSVPRAEKLYRLERYNAAYSNMIREFGAMSLQVIKNAVHSLPKFDITMPKWYDCYCNNRAIRLGVGQLQEVRVETTNTVTKITQEGIAYEVIQFEVGLGTPPQEIGNIADGDYEITINVAGIKQGSMNIVLDTQTLHENVDDQISYSVQYNLNNAIITFNQGVKNGQKYRISFSRTV